MLETRRLRLQSLIQQQLSHFIQRHIQNPVLSYMTITRIELNPSGSQAYVYISALTSANSMANDETIRNEKTSLCLHELQKVSGRLRNHLSKVLKIRQPPELLFQEDKGLDHTERVLHLLKEINYNK